MTFENQATEPQIQGNKSQSSEAVEKVPLSAKNYKKGFLVDDTLMGGVSELIEETGEPAGFSAFVLSPNDGEYLVYEEFAALQDAIDMINSIERDWSYEEMVGCGGGKCGSGSCVEGGCGG